MSTKEKQDVSLRRLILETFLGNSEADPFLDPQTSQLVDFFVDIIQAKTFKWYTPEKQEVYKAIDMKTYIDLFTIKEVQSTINLTNSLVKRKLAMAKDERQYINLSSKADEGEYF